MTKALRPIPGFSLLALSRPTGREIRPNPRTGPALLLLTRPACVYIPGPLMALPSGIIRAPHLLVRGFSTSYAAAVFYHVEHHAVSLLLARSHWRPTTPLPGARLVRKLCGFDVSDDVSFSS